MLMRLSAIIIPALFFYIVLNGVLNKTDVYDAFVKGAMDGLKTVVTVLPTLVGLMVAVGVLRASGFLTMLANLFGGLTEKVGIGAEFVPLVFIKMFSSSAATGLVLDIFKQYGADSRTGLLTSIMMSCTETCFYTMSVYYMAAKVKKQDGLCRAHFLPREWGLRRAQWLCGGWGEEERQIKYFGKSQKLLDDKGKWMTAGCLIQAAFPLGRKNPKVRHPSKTDENDNRNSFLSRAALPFLLRIKFQDN